jgi:anti-sigma B factor antagonist
MQFTIEAADNGATVVRPHGRLNMVTAASLKEVVTDAVAEGSISFVIDLSAVEFMDSSGLGALVSGLKTARRAGGDLRIASATEQVGMVLKLTNLDRVLTMYDSVADALAASDQPAP